MKIACIGNIVYDKTAFFDAPIAIGGKNSTGRVSYATGGPASTAASVIAKGDNQVDFYGQVGLDNDGRIVCEEMAKEGINMSHVNVDPNDMTPNGYIAIAPDGERTIFSMSKQNNHGSARISTVNFETDYNYILTDGKFGPDSEALIKANPEAISIIDAGRWNDGVLRVCQCVDYIICSEEFANHVTGKTIDYDPQNNAEIFGDLQNRFPNAKGITITIGKRGYICEKNGEVVTIPAYQPEQPTIDTNGAGDIFHGAFTHALASGYDYHNSLEFANITAALSTTRHGGRKSCPELAEVEELMNQQKLVRRPKY